MAQQNIALALALQHSYKYGQLDGFRQAALWSLGNDKESFASVDLLAPDVSIVHTWQMQGAHPARTESFSVSFL